MRGVKKIGIIGYGNMGEAIVRQLLSCGYRSSSISICDKRKTRVDYIRRKYKIKIARDNRTLVALSDIVVLAVKPQDFNVLLKQISGSFKKQLVISIAAGITTKYIEKKLGRVKVIRAMPNMPAQIGKGITALTKGRFATDRDLKTADKIFKTLGETVIIGDEELIDAVTALSGSGPAYLFFIFDAMLVAAETLGLDRKSANSLIYHTTIGSMDLLNKYKFDAEMLIFKVASKGGTTEAALRVFKRKKMRRIITDAVKAAFKRAGELSR